MTAPYKFSVLPSNSSVAALVTMLVSGWFLLASGAILIDRHADRSAEAVRLVPVVAVTAVREEPFKIVVTANRAGDTL